jgi:calcineurin-like phosphoesterase family protein
MAYRVNSDWTPEEDELLMSLYEKGATASESAEMMQAKGYRRTEAACGLRRRKLAKDESGPARPKVERKRSPNRSLEELMADQAQRFKEKEARHKQKRGWRIDMPDDGPYGLMVFGDPHVDDDGCDIEHLAYCLEWANSRDRVHAVNVGDLTNNWVGRLGRLYAHQHTTDDEGEELMRWLVSAAPWLWIILGNHDKWGPLAGAICRDADVLGVSHGAKFHIWSGENCVKVDCRHTHKGHSQYTPNFAQVKQNYRGSDCDVIIAGHTHTSAVTQIRNGVADQISLCIRVGAFKRYDEYADQLGFDDESLGPAALVVIRPDRQGADRAVCFHDLDAGEAFLDAMVNQWQSE